MDRIIEKKKWTTKKILRIAAIVILGLFLIKFLFFKETELTMNMAAFSIPPSVDKMKNQRKIKK